MDAVAVLSSQVGSAAADIVLACRPTPVGTMQPMKICMHYVASKHIYECNILHSHVGVAPMTHLFMCLSVADKRFSTQIVCWSNSTYHGSLALTGYYAATLAITGAISCLRRKHPSQPFTTAARLPKEDLQ